MASGDGRRRRRGAVAPSTMVTVVFREAGALGIKFGWDAAAGCVELLAVVPGTQAADHEALAAGLILASVAGASVRAPPPSVPPTPAPPRPARARPPGSPAADPSAASPPHR